VDECGDELAHVHAVREHAFGTVQALIAHARMESIQLVRLLGKGTSRARWAQLKRFLRTGAGSPAKAVLVSTFETSTTRSFPRSVSTLTFMLVSAGTET
jgi:hypothetical protein